MSAAQEPPPQVLESGSRGLTQFAALIPVPGYSGADLGEAIFALAWPALVYTLSLRDLLEDHALDRAEPQAWRFVVQSSGRPVGIMDVGVDASGEAREASFSEGRLDVAVISAIAEQLGTLADVRWLSVPALYVTALWLHGSDEFVPVPTPREQTRKFSVIPSGDYLGGLRARAQRRAEAVRDEADDVVP